MADPHGDAAPARAADALHEGRLDEPYRLEGVVGSEAVRQLDDALDGVLLRGVDGVGRAELHGHVQLVVEDVDGDDGRRACDLCALHAVEPDAARAEYGYRRARLHPGGVDGRADARGDAAAHQSGLGEGNVLVDGHRGDLGDGRVRGEGAQVAQAVDGGPVAAPLELRAFQWVVAQVGPALLARLAYPAARLPGEDDVVAGLDVGHARAGRLYHARALVTQHGRKGMVRPLALHDVPVGVAYA